MLQAMLLLAAIYMTDPLASSMTDPPAPGWTLAELPGEPAIEARILALTNAARIEARLKPLRPDDRLRAAARQHSGEMQTLGYFSHRSPVSSHGNVGDRALLAGFAWLGIGENIFSAEGLKMVDGERAAKLAVDGWLASPSHRANLLTEDHTAIGVGVVVRAHGFEATQVFGSPVPDPS